MQTPIVDFLQHYAAADPARFHMPGHKGHAFLGCEPLDLTEIPGADSLYEAQGIIAESEAHASALYGSQRTCYSTEGSSQCIRAMLYLALQHDSGSGRPVIAAARNAHRSFLYAAALLDFDILWLWPEESHSLCHCPISPGSLEQTLSRLPVPPAAVYLTSPDYLGGMADLSALAEICHRHDTLLLVDNAHGAYLHFLSPSLHPLDLGADLCCDSAHKTLPVLTGGAYLHVSRRMPSCIAQQAKNALALFGSTSPSYLTLASLDLCNRYLDSGYPSRLAETTERLHLLRQQLLANGWRTEVSDPLRLVIHAPVGSSGLTEAQRLASQGIYCEYADRDVFVLMATPENSIQQLQQLKTALGKAPSDPVSFPRLPLPYASAAISVRQALFSPSETIPVEDALGRVCGAPVVSCPPAIPIAVSGEYITQEALTLFRYYGISTIEVLQQKLQR